MVFIWCVYVSVVVLYISGVYSIYVSVIECISIGMCHWWWICISNCVYVSVGQREATLKRHAPDWLLAMEEACTDLAHIKLLLLNTYLRLKLRVKPLSIKKLEHIRE